MIGILLFALQVCYAAPTENVDGSLIQPGELDYFTIYYGTEGVGDWERQRIVNPESGCTNLRVAPGVWYLAMTATNVDDETSVFSSWIQKEEERLDGPSGGRLIGPSNGTVITE